MAGAHSKGFFSATDKTILSLYKKDEDDVFSLPLKILSVFTVVALVVTLSFAGNYLSEVQSQKEISVTEQSLFAEYKGAHPESLINELKNRNSDAVAWINVPETEISTAVYQAEDNEFYLTHDARKQKNRFGSVFLSSKNSFEAEKDKNAVVYGTNMHEELLFGALEKYRNIFFYKSNPVVNLYTETSIESFVVCAVLLIDPNDMSEYSVSKSHFINAEEFSSWYSDTTQRSIIKSNIPAVFGDSFLTLITPCDDFEDARLAVVAKRLQDTDSDAFDATSASINKNIRYPKIWYDERGREYPY